MKFLRPIPITDSVLIDSSLPETDHAAWSSATTYAAGARVILTSTHRIYESVQAGNTNHDPATDDGTWWIDIGPTNRWAMFDQSVGTVSTGTNPVSVSLDPGQGINSLALLGLVASTVRVQVEVDAELIYDRLYNMADRRITMGWWEYFFEPLDPQTDLIVDDLPPIGEITITINGTACATLAIGRLFDLGETLAAPTVGIIDYSRKETDIFGVTDVLERSYAKRIEADVLCDSNRIDGITRQLADIRATPVVWVADANRQSSVLTAYGFYRSWELVIRYHNTSECRLTIEGLT